MPKLSFAQEMYEMERVVAAARSNVGILPDPDLALTLADQLAAIIAEAKELKGRQQALLAAQMVKTEEMAVLIQRGTWVVRRLRAYILLVLGTKHAQLTQFGIRLRRRPRRKAAKPSAKATEPAVSIRDDRPEDRRSRAIVEPDGATVAEVGGTVLQLGGEDSGIGADVASLGAAAPPERGTVSPPGGTAAEDRALVPEDRADANRRGAIVPETRAAAARAA
jgi:hypothetical protein